MKIALMLGLMLAACTTSEEAVVENGGPAPVTCFNVEHFDHCRDHAWHYWVCERNGKFRSSCIRASAPSETFNARLAPAEMGASK